MKSTFGQSITLTIAGESHGAALTAIVAGLAPGLRVDEAFIAEQMDRRRAVGVISTARHEPDEVEILSGVFQGRTTGTPVTLLIRNRDMHSADYAPLSTVPRPGHADYTAQCKYHGFQDYRGGGHFSGRITAAAVAAGALVLPALREKGIAVATHIARCAGIDDRAFAEDPAEDMAALGKRAFAVLDEAAGERMQAAIKEAKAAGDSVGGVLETLVTGVPAGVGEPWFDSVESVLSHLLFSIPGVKGVAFGDGFALADKRGSEANDPFGLKDGAVCLLSGHNGGINGGITNGSALRFCCAVKPTPSIARPQQTVDLSAQTEQTLTVRGRHDPAIIHRARVVVDSLTALGLADLLAQRFGTDWLSPAAT